MATATNGHAESPTHEEEVANGLAEKGAEVHEETAHEAAEHGHVATDKYVSRPLRSASLTRL